MHWLIHVAWKGMLVPDTSVLEIFVRGTFVSLVLFAMLSLVLKRRRGGVAFTDEELRSELRTQGVDDLDEVDEVDE